MSPGLLVVILLNCPKDGQVNKFRIIQVIFYNYFKLKIEFVSPFPSPSYKIRFVDKTKISLFLTPLGSPSPVGYIPVVLLPCGTNLFPN